MIGQTIIPAGYDLKKSMKATWSDALGKAGLRLNTDKCDGCGPCKPVVDRPPLPCVTACKPGVIAHSW